MRKYLTAIALFLIATSANAAPANNLSITPPKARSADQMECLKNNADNHPGYLACIRAKKGLKNDDAQNNKLSKSGSPLDSNMNSSIR